MRRQVVQYVIVSQLVFIATIAVCVLIKPSVILDNTAISVYGSLPATFAPFVIGLSLVAILFIRAARLLPKTDPTDLMLRRLFIALAVLIFGLAATPLFVNSFFFVAHCAIATVLWLVEMVASSWLVRRTGPNISNTLLLTIQIISFLVMVVSTSQIGLLDLMATAQISSIFAFGILLIRSIAHLEHVELKI